MRILFVTLTNIGDVVLSTALLERVLAAHPNATVDIAVGPLAAELFSGMPNLGKVHVIHKQKRHMHYWHVWRAFAAQRYDYIFDLRTPLLRYMLRGKHKRGFTKSSALHRAKQFAALWPAEAPIRLRVWLHDEVRSAVAAQRPTGRLIVLAPTANWFGKQWPQKKFAALKLHTLPGFEQAHFVVLGAKHEAVNIDDFIQTLPPERTLSLVGATTIAGAAAWVETADMFIGNDSGLGHIAAACHTPSLTLFGPTNEQLYAPFSPVAHIVCAPERPLEQLNLAEDALPRLICDITPDMVREKLAEMNQLYFTNPQQERQSA